MDPAVQAVEVPGKGIGLVAAGDVAAGDVLLSVPLAAVLNEDWLFGVCLADGNVTSVVVRVCRALVRSDVDAAAVNAAALLVASSGLAGGSTAALWEAYRASFLHPDAALPLLRASACDPCLGPALRARVDAVQLSFERFRDAWEGDQSTLLWTAAQWVEAAAVVYSRTHMVEVPAEDAPGMWTATPSLVPLVDLANRASSGSEVTMRCGTAARDTFRCEAASALRRGAAVLAEYVGSDPERLAVDYGMCPADVRGCSAALRRCLQMCLGGEGG